MHIATLSQIAQKRYPLTSIDSERGWYPVEGSWRGFQRDITLPTDTVLANWIVFSCMTLIAGDIGKMRVKLMERVEDGIWEEITSGSTAFLPVLRKPNAYQTRQKFVENWILSKLSRGNTYVLKARDARGVVVALYVLDPSRVKVLVSDSGDVFYELQPDDLAKIPEVGERVVVPASEIIHDRMWCLFHPLVGMSPLFASALAASQGLKIQNNSATFFDNMSRPSGVLTAPAKISDELAARLKAHWEENYKAGSTGKVAVLGDALKYEQMSFNAADSQLVEQLRMTAEMICSTFHVPAYKVQVGPYPTYQNGELANQSYYDTALQPLIEAVEACLDEGLGLTELTGKTYATELDLDALLRMDTASQVDALTKEVGAGIISPNEARKRRNRRPVTGGESPMIQQQNFSLEALAKRDKSEDPFGKVAPPALPAPAADTAKQIELANSVRLLVDEQKAMEVRRLKTEENVAVAQFSVEVMKRFAETVDG